MAPTELERNKCWAVGSLEGFPKADGVTDVLTDAGGAVLLHGG